MLQNIVALSADGPGLVIDYADERLLFSDVKHISCPPESQHFFHYIVLIINYIVYSLGL